MERFLTRIGVDAAPFPFVTKVTLVTLVSNVSVVLASIGDEQREEALFGLENYDQEAFESGIEDYLS